MGAAHPPRDPTETLFAGTYRQIRDFYLEPIAVATVARSALAELGSDADAFAVDPSGDPIIFRDHGKVVEEIDAPAPNDPEAWGRVTAAAVRTARAHAASLAAEGNEAIYQRLFNGIVVKLDRFSRYAGADQARDQKAQRDGFGGVGVSLDYTGDIPRITTVVPDGPAAHAGVLPNDRIAAIDGEVLTSLNERAVGDRLRGPIDTKVVLTLNRAGLAQPLPLTLTRALIVPATVAWEWDGSIGVFHVSSFNRDTGESLAAALGAARQSAPGRMTGIVLDLRDDTGGLLDQSVEVAGLFVGRHEVARTLGRHPTATQFLDSTHRDLSQGLPLVVLVNGSTASAAEIVASALQDLGRGVLVGSSSFGKGTVQEVLPLENSGELTLTWARLYTPTGYVLHQHGVVPAFCTSAISPTPPAPAPDPIAAVIEHGLHPTDRLQTIPKVALSEPAWVELRQSCPVNLGESPLDMKVAEKLLTQPELYARAMALGGSSIARADGHAVHSSLE
jgi:carboxyl-terminal processing protease